MADARVVVIGGGAAGLCAAIAAARRGAAVTIVEADNRVGRKILASGNGRCNLTNVAITPQAYNQPEFVAPVLERFRADAVLAFFSAMGLVTVADDEGRVYPASNAASSVLDVLRLECERLGVVTLLEAKADAIERTVSGFEVISGAGVAAHGDAVVIATAVGPLLGQLGHANVPTSPVLGPVRTDTEPIRGLSGVRVKCAASLVGGDGSVLASERGELLFRDYGVSGIMVFDLSRYLEPGCSLSIDLLPDLALPQAVELVAARTAQLSWRSAETFFTGMLHDRVARAVLRAAGVSARAGAQAIAPAAVAAVLKDFRLHVKGMGEAKQSQVTRGGATVIEFDAVTMASERVDGVFAAGEVLDVDGRSGGFNLHWAWASGIVAGESAATFAAARSADSGAHGSRGSA